MPLAIRCHPYAPVDVDEIEQWLEREIAHVREDASGATVRLLRLTQELPSGGQAVGWLIEFEVEADFLEDERLAAILSEMRLLGLQPTVLESSRRTPGPNGAAGCRTPDTRPPEEEPLPMEAASATGGPRQGQR